MQAALLGQQAGRRGGQLFGRALGKAALQFFAMGCRSAEGPGGRMQGGQPVQQLLAGLAHGRALAQLGAALGQRLVQGLAHRGKSGVLQAQTCQCRLQRSVQAQCVLHGIRLRIQSVPDAGAARPQVVQRQQLLLQGGALQQLGMGLLQCGAATALAHSGVRSHQATTQRQLQALTLEGQRILQGLGIGLQATPQAVAGFSQGQAGIQLVVDPVQGLQALHLGRPAFAAMAFGHSLQAVEREGFLRARGQQGRIGLQGAARMVGARAVAGPQAVGRRAGLDLVQLFAQAPDAYQSGQVVGDARLARALDGGFQRRAHLAPAQPGQRPEGLAGLGPFALQLRHVELAHARAVLDGQALAQRRDLVNALQAALQLVAQGHGPGRAQFGLQATALRQQVQRLGQARLQLGRPGSRHLR